MSWTLYYDGGCNLCHASKLRVERWAERTGRPLRALPIQSDEGLEKGYTLEGMVLEADGKVFVSSEAWIELLQIAPWYFRWIYAIRNVPGIKQLLRWGYGVVAKNRIRWFGSRECKLPPRKVTSSDNS